ncbi:MAG: MarR family winged helix-turn-helix transcriptional regulator [Microthrixaceae bacterium]|nr:winged helix-turn-helix transcriptional regulator [Microthrixaceae bacterium]MCO5311578.1 MarR family winged helix-turn-helix transcriptional regulator [Microthrixaceae bacterium]
MDNSVTPGVEMAEQLAAAWANIERSLSRSISGVLGVSYSEYRILNALAAAPDHRASRVDLADAVGLTPSGVTRALKPLEKIGMVDSLKHERDARLTLATLTRSGARTVANANSVIAERCETLLANAPTARRQVEQLTSMLAELASA